MGKSQHQRTRAVVLTAMLLLMMNTACSRPQPRAVNASTTESASAPPPAPVPAPPAPTPPLARADLVQAARAAADAAAQGAAYPAQSSSLIGRAFSIRLPFGCPDEAAESADGQVAIDPKKKTITLTAQPQTWTKAPWIAAAVGDPGSVEAVEGFWIRRPWTSSNLCPPAQEVAPEPPADAPGPPADAATAPTPSAETVGLARVYRTGDSRLKRHGRRPYKLVLKLTDEKVPADHRFWLHLEGRVVALEPPGVQGERHAIGCAVQSAERRPICLIGVEVDRVAIEAQSTGDVLGEWAG